MVRNYRLPAASITQREEDCNTEDVAPPCSAVAAIVFRRVLPGSSVSSDPIGDGGSGVVGLGALSSVKALSSPSPSHDRSRFSARGSISFSLVVSVLSVS